MDKVLVVGGTGLIGSNLINQLLEKKYKVYSVSNKRRKIEIKAKFFFLDLSKKNSLNTLKKINPKIIIYTASLDSGDAEVQFNKGHQIGYLSLVNILNTNSIKKNLKKIIFLSTAQVYLNYCKDKINLKSEVYPKSAYSLFHIQSENYLRYFSKKNNIDAISLRISNGYGEPYINQKSSWSVVVNNLCHQAFTKGTIMINSNPYDFRNFIYVKDIAREIIFNIKNKNKKIFEIKNIGSNENHRIYEVANIIKSQMNEIKKKNIKIFFRNKKNKNIKMYNYETNNVLSNTKLTSLKNGIKNLIKYMSQNNGKI